MTSSAFHIRARQAHDRGCYQFQVPLYLHNQNILVIIPWHNVLQLPTSLFMYVPAINAIHIYQHTWVTGFNLSEFLLKTINPQDNDYVESELAGTSKATDTTNNRVEHSFLCLITQFFVITWQLLC